MIDIAEASEYLAFLEDRLEVLQDAERKPGAAILRGVFTSGELETLLSYAIALSQQLFPQLCPDCVADMAEANIRLRH